MARAARLTRLLALLALLSATAVQAQDNNNNNNDNLPDLNAVTAATPEPATTDEQTTAQKTDETTAATTAEATTGKTEDTTETTATASFPDATTATNSGATPFRLTGLPTIAGAGVPTLVIPYTADAPFMQKSTMPEGTVFIAVGAVLASFGAFVILWRGLVAWSINRSVKRAAMASIQSSEKNPAWGAGGHGTGKSGYYKEYETGSSMSLDHLTNTGKVQKPGKHDDGHRNSSVPPTGLFFSPTAQANNRTSSYNADGNRGSAYLPAGYYASPSAELAGGRNSTVIGGSLAPYARNNNSGVSPSPPGSPSLPHSRSTSNYYGGAAGDSRSGLRQQSREGHRAPSREGYGGSRGSHVHSSLMAGQSTTDLPGQRAPSAVLDEMFENHGNGPRERF